MTPSAFAATAAFANSTVTFPLPSTPGAALPTDASVPPGARPRSRIRRERRGPEQAGEAVDVADGGNPRVVLRDLAHAMHPEQVDVLGVHRDLERGPDLRPAEPPPEERRDEADLLRVDG